jgi:subtilase family serine protease
MENDNTGNFQSPSLNYLMNSAYSAGARTHTNSWGSKAASQQGKYDSEAEDVDDRANYYDKYYNGREGLTILFAAGNDGPGTGTVSPPATAKNILSVGNHQNRYSGAPDTLMSGSSRGPTDDGRIKPDVIAPGGYVRSCRAQEATDTSGSTWSNNWYLEYTGTSMATPNAAGAAAMVREYLEEIAQRPAPQGALVKALLVLGAQDIGTRDIPNDDEGWGRINLRETLAPQSGQGIWVDDRSVLSGSGNSKSYSFNLT